MQITKKDFDNAVKQPWCSTTCILAQLAIRTCGGIGLPSDIIDIAIIDDFDDPAAENAMNVFDIYFNNPGDENKPELQALRASLPITI